MAGTLDTLFNPRGIAVVGVSESPDKLSSVIFNNILNAGFRNPVYPVNPKYEEVLEHKCFPSVSAIPSEVDLAVIVIPAEFVLDSMQDCAGKDVKNVIIISGGFKETGPGGAEMEKNIKNLAREAGINLLGPNCLGIIVPEFNLNASFAAQTPANGNIAFLSQSGAINTAVLDMAEQERLGFSHFVSLGNKAGLTENDFLEYWLQDDSVKVIGMYLEEVHDGKDFLELLQKYPRKPVVILHPGKSKEAQAAMRSHTGSLTGSELITKTAFRQAGIIQVHSLEKLFNTLKLLSWSKIPGSRNTAIVTNAGGPGIMVTDMVSAAGLDLIRPSDATKALLRESLPDTASVNNPIDIVGDALVDRYRAALEALENEPELSTIIILLTPQLVTQIEETAKLVISMMQTTSKVYIPIFLGGTYVNAGLDRLYDNQVAAFRYAEEAVAALKSMIEFSEAASGKIGARNYQASHGEYRGEIQQLLAAGRTTVPQALTAKMAKEAGLELPKERLVGSFNEAEDFLKEIGGKVVVKATAEDIAHKTDTKALFLNIETSEQLSQNYDELVSNIRSSTGNDSPKILIQEQLKVEHELLLGLNRDGGSNVYAEDGLGFGHIIVFGKGGIYTEVYRDFAAALVPIDISQAEELIARTKVSKVIKGFRGNPPLAKAEILKVILALQFLALNYPEISSMDINPLVVDEQRAVALDIKIFISH